MITNARKEHMSPLAEQVPVCSSETLVTIYEASQWDIPEGHHESVRPDVSGYAYLTGWLDSFMC
jgi:hypothetical protein